MPTIDFVYFAKKYLELTEVIYQAICADQFDVAENAIFERDYPLSQLVDTNSTEQKLVEFEGVEEFKNQVKYFESKIDAEFKRFGDNLLKESIENKKQLQNLKAGSKVVKQYTGYSDEPSGSTFDNRK